MSPTSLSRYVTRNPEVLQGEPIIADTQVTVRDIVVFWKSGIKPEEIPQKLLQLVTPAQVFDAISFYLDNQPEIDGRIAWYEARPMLNISPLLRCNPLLNEVTKYVEVYRRDRNADIDFPESEAV
ncbi:MAG: DUF433 domain-containing protein [Microcoleus sp. PH2017_10_PVI_O_A]|nr:DUF433 domain-containing protein [Microcoleus sp. PH2017_10_PVI_O_A]MCC3462433.1 DUF433 domain-containing protein [Microcoleus sp. PH2017_11_PCY_U_A]MCC3480331.1 DUF433 domain-containing protein [Microcoleus sp. PH2017_12_PCY_D_A]MCC3527076.1 DUF433 domain-containing protein [Microcoleus sp. PH2017_21_RUC_O_A]MCC3540275.1 DUF433 domain-containing protein [Microcoleus sp. PH2017_22_RUC_O_B]MCC3561837.1 DUF433 domain-containing protein [Microcoleus sp. PH2017_27_LUM_O_A]TAE79382.1 MAG: DUF43